MNKAEFLVIGFGYVGKELALAIQKSGAAFSVYDPSENARRSAKTLGAVEAISRVDDSSQMFSRIVICVPTPLDSAGLPDHSHVDIAFETARQLIEDEGLIALESTVAIGKTEALAEEITCHKFHIGFSPERVDPGSNSESQAIPKIISGVHSCCLKLVNETYSKIGYRELIHASSPKAAEMAKLQENSFRLVNIALANEFADIAESNGLVPEEINRLAKSKPFGYMGFDPGPGAGGHCIPVDPKFLLLGSGIQNLDESIIGLSLKVNGKRASQIAAKIAKQVTPMSSEKKLLIYGTAYKEGVMDLRNSPGTALGQALSDFGVQVSFTDSMDFSKEIDSFLNKSQIIIEMLNGRIDAVVALHSLPGWIYRYSELVIFNNLGELRKA